MALLLLGSLPACGSDEGRAATVAKDFLTAWAAGDVARAAALTDAAEAAGKGLREANDKLAVTAAAFKPEPVRKGEDGTATVPFHTHLTLRGLGGWDYDSVLPLREKGGQWRVRWSPAVIHPKLTEDTLLRRSRELPPRASILARDSAPLVAERPVVTVGVWPGKLSSPQQAFAALAPFGVDVAKLGGRVKAAKPDGFVEAVTLRESDYVRARARLEAIPGLVFRKGSRSLALTPAFARAALGGVGPATEETLRNAGELASPADLLGSSGLQLAYQKQLAGTPGGKVELVDRAEAGEVAAGGVAAVLRSFPGRPGEPLRTTLDIRTQAAAEQALAGVGQPSALVAVKPSTGEVLAVANGPGVSAYNRAFLGTYPPGSTFKVVTTTALLGTGLRPETTVPCPPEVTVSGKRFENQDSLGALGAVPFLQDFARSCNTAFIGLRGRLGGTALPDAAAVYGLGGTWKVGLPASSGSVPSPASEVELAADMIGQGKVVVSPLAMASVAATVAAGTFRQPVLLPNQPGRLTAARPLPAATATQLRTLMRTVVTEGSGAVLKGISGEPAAKTGTAEFGTATPPRTHAWMIGYRGDLAFAVLIEGGGSGGRNAGPVVARFLSALG